MGIAIATFGADKLHRFHPLVDYMLTSFQRCLPSSVFEEFKLREIQVSRQSHEFRNSGSLFIFHWVQALLCGRETVEVTDLKANFTCSGSLSESTPIVEVLYCVGPHRELY
jgi:hypothetical protein